MLTFIFDKDLDTEKSIQFNSLNEVLGVNRLNASREIKVTSSADIPDLSDFNGFTSFQTLNIITGDNIEFPVAGTYNYIDALNVSYYDNDKSCQVNISLTNK